ncbi:MAG: S41 family peptidase [Bacteroidetes bacterium]|nr:S41 family peptidase [Bacteroidota bacterium]
MKVLIIAIFILMVNLNHGYSQDELLIDAKTKEEVVKKVASIMKEKYVFADIGDKMAKHIIEQFEKGEYKSYIELEPFCKKMTSDLRDISNDKHIYVFFSPEEALLVRAEKGMLPKDEIKKINERYIESDKKENFGFKKVEILDGNIGYLDIRYFTNSDTLEETLNGAMKFLSNSDAIIIDLRDNGGGTLTPLLPSYFLSSDKVYLGGCVCRDTIQNEYSWSLTNINGKRMLKVELYILTNSKTFSAAEDFSYTMQSLKRAVVVGETTKGGAHPVDVLIVKGDILTQIPICESYNPITKSNWEGVGVKPDYLVASEDALNTAYVLALKNIIRKTSDEEYKSELTILLKNVEK